MSTIKIRRNENNFYYWPRYFVIINIDLGREIWLLTGEIEQAIVTFEVAVLNFTQSNVVDKKQHLEQHNDTKLVIATYYYI